MNRADFDAGSLAALEAFREELLEFRGEIENETEPIFDVIIDCLNRSIGQIATHTREKSFRSAR